MKETFGQRFQRLRKEAGLTQEEVAEKVGITPQGVSKWENDLSSPDINILVKLAEILGVSVEELLGKEKEKTKVLQDFDYKKAVLKIVVDSEGDKVKINFPLALGEAVLGTYLKLGLKDEKDALEGIDFEKIFDLVKQGVIGELVNVESSDGTKVSIRVEY